MFSSSVKKYIDDTMGALATRAANGEDLDDGTFLAYLVTQDKLTPEEIIGSVSEVMPASVDTVRMLFLNRGGIDFEEN